MPTLLTCFASFSQVFQLPPSHLLTDATTLYGPAFSLMQVVLDLTAPDSSSLKILPARFLLLQAGRAASGPEPAVTSADPEPSPVPPETVGPVKLSVMDLEPLLPPLWRSSLWGRVARTFMTSASSTGTTCPCLWRHRVGRVYALRRAALRTWTSNVRRSWGSVRETPARARVRRLGVLSIVAVARSIHPPAANRLCTRRCSSPLVQNLTATHTMMPLARSHAAKLIIRWLFARLLLLGMIFPSVRN